MALFFQRDASLTVYPETSAGTFANGDTAFTKYTGTGELGKNGTSTYEFIGGTGKYKSISGSGTVTRVSIQAAKKGFTQTKNVFKGSYKLN